MSFLDNLLGNPQQQQDSQDFVNRYQQGSPQDGYSPEEAVQRYQQVAANTPPQDYQAAAMQTFAQMSPQQRQQLGQMLIQSAQQQGVQLPQSAPPSNDPGGLAQLVTGLHQQQPGLLPQLLGGGSNGNLLSNPIAKMALAGIAAMAAQRMMGGH